jgi:hypothetical protein
MISKAFRASRVARPFRWLRAAAGAAILLAPICAYAQQAPNPYGAAPANGYQFPPSSFASWLDMVSATQAAQPSWMTPLVTVTPRLEQEFRFDFYDQQNGTGSQGNGQHIVNYGGPGGPRVELIPAWNWEVILAPPPYETATGPKGRAIGRLFLSNTASLPPIRRMEITSLLASFRWQMRLARQEKFPPTF